MAGQSDAELYSYWMKELTAANKREGDYIQHAQEIVKLYEADKKKTHQFNILYANTETLGPALYNACPRPDVKPKNKKARDPVLMAATKLSQALLEAMIDSGSEEESSIDTAFKSAVQGSLVPGRGILWFKYEAEVAENEEGEPVSTEYECVEPVIIPYDRYRCGFATTWVEVPWIAAIWHMTKSEIKEKFGEQAVADVSFSQVMSGETEDDNLEQKEGNPDLACVYEIWDKESKQVIFLAGTKSGKVLKVVPDPLKLDNFFPGPEPLQLFKRVSSLLPVPLYDFYEEQAEELNDITARIRQIVRTIRVRGGYDATIDEIKDIVTAEDGKLIPLNNVAAIGNGQGANLNNVIWFQPLKEPIMALQQLYVQRDSVKQTIYEITGIADIMRGATQASETLGAQQIKNQWGTLRLKRSQQTVGIFCRNALRVMLEIAVKNFSPETIKAMTNSSLIGEQEKQQLAMQAQMAQQMGQQVPPELQQMLSQPTLEQVLAFLQNDMSRNLAVDIETNSTVDLEATEDKKDFSELLNAISQFMNGVAPMIEQGIMDMQSAGVILLSVVRRFRLGHEVEDQLIAMASKPPQQKSDPEAEKAKAEMQMKQQESQLTLAVQKQKSDLELSAMQQKMAMEQQLAQQELQIKQEELQLQRAALEMEREKMILQHQIAMREGAMKAATAEKKPDANI